MAYPSCVHYTESILPVCPRNVKIKSTKLFIESECFLSKSSPEKTGIPFPLTTDSLRDKILKPAGVVELVDSVDLGSSA